MNEERARHLRFALIAIVVFLAAYNVRLFLFRIGAFDAFYRAHSWEVGETIWKTLWIAIAAIGVIIAHRVGIIGSLRELGLARTAGWPLAAAFIATLPMLVAFAATFPINPEFDWLRLWMTGIVSPISEEVLFRGYLFRQLYERARWPFWLAVLANIVPFAWGHLNQGAEAGMGIRGYLLVLLFTGGGAALFSWLLVRWKFNLWFAIGMHALMNVWWYVFAVDETAIGGRVANVARIVTYLLAIGLTLYAGRLAAKMRAV